MKFTTYIFSLMAALSLPLFTSCGHNDPTDDLTPPPGEVTQPEEPEEPTNRTVLVYMVAKSNLSSYSEDDLREMYTAAANGDLGDSRLIVYQESNNQSPVLFEITPDGQRTVMENYSDNIMSVTSERLCQVIDDTKRLAPATNYGLIFWGHGTGYVQDGLIENFTVTTQSYGGQSANRKSYWMNTTTMAKALEGKNFDWIYFDCCFMMGIEVVYELRNVTNYIAGSATELPADGTCYEKMLKHLMPVKSDLVAAAEETFNHYNAMSGSLRTCTMSVVDTHKLDNLADAMRVIYTTTNGLPDDYTPQEFQTPDDHRRYGWSYYDLQHYASALANNTTNLNLISVAISDAVIYANATPKLWDTTPLTNHCGLSTLIIESSDDSLLDKFNYRELAWWNDVVKYRFN